MEDILKTEPRLYSISETAFKYIQQIAVRQGYLKPRLAKSRGLSEFLEDLAYASFIDTRPLNIVDRHNMEINIHRAPRWTSYIVRKARMITITEDAIKNYILIAYKFGIIKDPPYAVGGPSITKPVSVVGYVLEGIGLKWLTAEKLPVKDIYNERPNIESMEKQEQLININKKI